MELNAFLHHFHFLRPIWLLPLPLLLGLAFWLSRKHANHGCWEKLIDPDLLPHLQLSQNDASINTTPWRWLALAWALASLALAGPSWQRYPSIAYQSQAAWVLVLDLSPSMLAADLPPSRITRAHYAIKDLLDAAQDTRIGLIVFGNESYTVSPLTDDVATIRALLAPLTPDILPTAGDSIAPALKQAAQLLQRTGIKNGSIIVLSDGFNDPSAALTAAKQLKDNGITLNIIGIGTSHGAPETESNGSFAKDAQGKMRMTHLDTDLLEHLAHTANGRYVDSTHLPELIHSLQNRADRTHGAKTSKDIQVTHWRDAGIWLLPCLLLVTAFLARRGWL